MIVSTLESVVGNLTNDVSFVYANLYEANFELDKLPANLNDLIFVYIPPLENTDTLHDNGLIRTRFPLQFFLMRKLNNPTIDYKSYDVQPYIDECRDIARQFIHLLQAEEVVDKSGSIVGGKAANGIEEVTYTSEYAWQDFHLFGVSAQCEVPIFENKTGCYV